MFDVANVFRGYKRFLSDKMASNTVSAYTLNAKMFLEYIYNVEDILNIVYLNRPFPNITKEDIEKWYRKLMSLGYSPASLKMFKYSIKSFFDYLYNFHRIKTPRVDDIELPKVPLQEIDALTDSEIRAIADCANNTRDKLIILLLYEAGMRRNELLYCSYNDIDFEHNIVNVYNDNKLDRVGYITSTTHALINQYQWEWTEEVKSINEKRMENYRKNGIRFRGVPESKYIFQTANSPQISYITIYRAIKNASFEYFINKAIKNDMTENEAQAYATSMTEKINSETLRHSRRAYYFSQGKNVDQVQTLMGDENYHVCKKYLKIAQQLYPEQFR